MIGGAMKRLSIIVGIVLFILIGCDISMDTAMRMYMHENADRVEILFYTGHAEKGLKPVLAQTFMDIENIDRVLKFITKKPAEPYKCGYSGEIIFFTGDNSSIAERMKFNIDPGCEHIVYMFNQEFYTRKISKEGLTFLRELRGKVLK